MRMRNPELANRLLIGLIASKSQGRMTYQFKKDLWEFTLYHFERDNNIKSGWADYDDCLVQAGKYWGRHDDPWGKVDLDKLNRGKGAALGLWIFYRQCVVSFPVQVGCRAHRKLRDSNVSRNINPIRSITETK